MSQDQPPEIAAEELRGILDKLDTSKPVDAVDLLKKTMDRIGRSLTPADRRFLADKYGAKPVDAIARESWSKLKAAGGSNPLLDAVFEPPPS